MNPHDVAKEMLARAAAAQRAQESEAQQHEKERLERVNIDTVVANTWPAELDAFKRAVGLAAESVHAALLQQLNVTPLPPQYCIRDAKVQFAGLHTGYFEQGTKKVVFVLEGTGFGSNSMVLSLYRGVKGWTARMIESRTEPAHRFVLHVSALNVASWHDENGIVTGVEQLAETVIDLLLAPELEPDAL